MFLMFERRNFKSFITFDIYTIVVFNFILILYLLLLFQPLGLNKLPFYLVFIISLGYSIMPILAYTIIVIVSKPFVYKKWSIMNEFIIYNCLLLFIWFLSFMYMTFCNEMLRKIWFNIQEKTETIDYPNFKLSIFYTLIIGYAIYFLNQIFYNFYVEYRKSNLKEIKEDFIINKKITLKGKNKNEELTIMENSLICIESEKHYINIFFLNETNDKLTKKTFRNSLKNIEFQTAKNHNIYRCHNSYLINIKMLISVRGNSHQSFAKIKYFPNKIPISQRKINFMKKLD